MGLWFRIVKSWQFGGQAGAGTGLFSVFLMPEMFILSPPIPVAVVEVGILCLQVIAFSVGLITI